MLLKEINYEKELKRALNDTLSYATEKGDIEKPEVKKMLDDLKKETEETIEAIHISENHNKRIRELISVIKRKQLFLLLQFLR